MQKKWCVTFESTIPRTNGTVDRKWEYDRDGFAFDKLTLRLFKALSEDNCIAIIAISECAYKIQREMLAVSGEKYANKLMKKTLVLHPPQKALISEESVVRKFESIKTLEILFVGSDFFRKGGAELVDVLSRYENVFDFHLTVISSLNYGDYASHSNEDDMLVYSRKLESYSWITWHKSLPNEEVLDFAKKAHVGCLPTLADTYGYSVLEMQACGCPVITSNVRALPEINDDSTGWVIELPLRLSGEATIETAESSKLCKQKLKDGLTDVFNQIFHYKNNELEEKALLSLERIRKQHDPVEYAKKLEKIYITAYEKMINVSWPREYLESREDRWKQMEDGELY